MLTCILLVVVSGFGYWNSKNQLAAKINTDMANFANQQVQQLDGWLLVKIKTAVC
ncbi:hypothetical protein [Sporomusa sp. KB1]|uniref:hypothetical protein n=1 Tax=Sporomusa sp. KB1 TaxID=943346 RepID=UPI001C984E46|nr:hypothetical protein [Sporomusa sp. KB1]